MEVIKLGPSSSLVSIRLSAVRKLRSRMKVCTARVRISQTCTAMLTKKSGLSASGHKDVLSNDWRKSTVCFKRSVD